ncbi:MAG: GntR family transcriptional regulator [Planctomycetota bacterium]|nr:MAG: GntR family transcriptional regulator [Planctomycetota bacterium]
MLLQIDHHSGEPIYRQIIRQIRRQIMTGQLKQADRLQTVRDLAARLNVNPMTISKAYSFLEAEGLVERKRGIGLFVAKIKTDDLQRIKTRLLNTIIDKAAITAVQLGTSEDEAVKFFKKYYRKYNSKNRRQE